MGKKQIIRFQIICDDMYISKLKFIRYELLDALQNKCLSISRNHDIDIRVDMLTVTAEERDDALDNIEKRKIQNHQG
jgi:hypothetical protein